MACYLKRIHQHLHANSVIRGAYSLGGLGKAYDGEIAFVSSLEMLGGGLEAGGHNDPISVQLEVERMLNDRLQQFVDTDMHYAKDAHKHFDKAIVLYDQELTHSQQYYFWKNYGNRLKHIVPRPLLEPPAAPAPAPPAAPALIPPASSPAQAPSPATMPSITSSGSAHSPMQFGGQPASSGPRADIRNNAMADRRKRKREG